MLLYRTKNKYIMTLEIMIIQLCVVTLLFKI
ncbi:hypothetical protein Alsa4_CDS0251 [Staphylococcus phage Alsa_4]|nr:hypothetical protein Alsa4_CDS0251 [Staphylococcus phage Alsa_4]